jgi:hypothetical protein
MRNPSFPQWSRSLAGLIVVLLLALSACSIGSTSASEQGGGSNNTNNSSSTPTPKQATACSDLSGFSGAQAATAGAGFSDVSFPANSISASIATSGGGAGRFTIEQFDACTPATTTSAVYSFFANGLPGAGWAGASSYPYDTAWQASCGDPYCWKKDYKPRYVSLEKVTDRGNGLVSYHVRLAIPPAGPTCSSGVDIYTGKTWDPNVGSVPSLQSPPMTLDGLGDGYDDSVAAHTAIQDMCSAGNITAVNNFFNTELPKHGWSHTTPSATMSSACHTSGAQWWKGKDLFQWAPDTISNQSAAANTVYWNYDYCHLLP